MINPKISVIVPVYNVEKYLSECLDSIVNQTLKDIEIICVNDGSTDNSIFILREYASKDNRIKIIDKENEGLGYTRKVGLDNAKGEYILFCDSDDKYVADDVFEKIYNEIKKNNSELMIFRFLYGDRNSDLLDNTNKSILIFNFYFSAWSKLYKKEFLDKYNYWFFPKYLKFEDMPFHIQCCLRTEAISYFDNVCYYYRVNNVTSIMNAKMGKKQLEDICKISLFVYNVLKEENCLDKYNLEFTYLVISQIRKYFLKTLQRTDLVPVIKEIFEKFSSIINSSLKLYQLTNNFFPYLNKESIKFYKVFIRLDTENICKYIEGKKQKEIFFFKKDIKNKNEQLQQKNELIKTKNEQLQQKKELIKTKNEQLQQKNEQIKNRDSVINQKNIEIQNLHNQNNIQDQVIKQLQNSWSYRIGRLFTYPISIPFEFYKYICDYNLIKKSDLFDSEYYLANNEDVKNAKVDPIKHYLKFGWKEGRNPSTEFDGNEYLNKRPDVKVAGICPLVHYLKFGKDEK